MERNVYHRLDQLEGEHWWFCARRQILKSVIARFAPQNKRLRLLEAGCGTGGNLQMLSEFGRLDAFELDDEARDIARHKLSIDIKSGMLPDGIPFKPGSFDVVVAFDVIEHRTYTVACSCGQRHDSVFPPEVTETVQYGPNVRALGVHLTQGQMLPYARAAELISELYGLPVSPATLLAWVGEASAALQGTADMIAHQLHHAPVLCADESGLRVDGKLHWMHVAATATLTSRRSDAMCRSFWNG